MERIERKEDRVERKERTRDGRIRKEERT